MFVYTCIKTLEYTPKNSNKIAICKGENGKRERSLLFVDYIFLCCFDF